jgi:hypothetical protein
MGSHLYTTDTFALNLSDSHVAVLTPAFSPRVFHDPVVLATLATVSDHIDSMIEGSSTILVVENSTFVNRRHNFVSLDKDRNGLLSNGSLHGANTFLLDLFVANSFDTSSFTIVSTVSYFCCVTVSPLCHEVVFLGIPKGLLNPTTSAAIVLSATIH